MNIRDNIPHYLECTKNAFHYDIGANKIDENLKLRLGYKGKKCRPNVAV